MTIKPIRNDDDLKAAFQRLECIFQAPEGTPEADEMEVLVTLIEAYENKHYPIGPADPVEAIKFRMEQEGLTPRDLEQYIGSSGRVSEVLNRKRSLSLRMIVRLHHGLKIPYEALLADVETAARGVAPETDKSQSVKAACPKCRTFRANLRTAKPVGRMAARKIKHA